MKVFVSEGVTGLVFVFLVEVTGEPVGHSFALFDMEGALVIT